jgi:hypothetical protein
MIKLVQSIKAQSAHIQSMSHVTVDSGNGEAPLSGAMVSRAKPPIIGRVGEDPRELCDGWQLSRLPKHLFIMIGCHDSIGNRQEEVKRHFLASWRANGGTLHTSRESSMAAPFSKWSRRVDREWVSAGLNLALSLLAKIIIEVALRAWEHFTR